MNTFQKLELLSNLAQKDEALRARLLDEPRVTVVKRVIFGHNTDDIAHFCTFFRKILAFSYEMITIRVFGIIIL